MMKFYENGCRSRVFVHTNAKVVLQMSVHTCPDSLHCSVSLLALQDRYARAKFDQNSSIDLLTKYDHDGKFENLHSAVAS